MDFDMIGWMIMMVMGIFAVALMLFDFGSDKDEE